MTWGVATEAESTVEVPLSPELVLVSPDLRERALRELTLPHESNGTRPHPLLLRDFARLHAAEPEEIEVSLLRGAGEAIAQVAVFAALFVLVVACAAFGLTIAPGETEPKLASRPGSLRPDAPGIGTAAVHGDVSVERQPGRAGDPWRHTPGPIGLTTQGQLVWNLDALVRDVFGSRPACLLYAPNQLSLVACSASPPGRTAYRTTFTGVDGSGFRLSNRSAPPTLRAYAVPLKLRTSYLSCGRGRWVAATANRALSCERELSRPER